MLMKISFDVQDSSLTMRRGHLHMGQKNNCGDFIDVTNRYIEKNGSPWIPIMGEFHYSRYDRSQWETELLKMKAGGIQIISSYLIWIHHEEEEGIFCFDGDRDLNFFAALCKKHGLYFLARLGPWVHAEVRNGGFPDWILNDPVRTNHPDYLFYVKRLYQAYYDQLKELLFLNGGPVIGIQLENELVDNPDHLMQLKDLAREIGFEVPLYTVTAWAVNGIGQFPKYEVLPVFGSYPEAPWRQNTDPFERKPHYLFAPGRNDITIGSDLIQGFTASQSEDILDDYPYLYCEIGPGVQATYHRRPVIRPYDLYTITMITLAKGNNLPGYYMYHGGRNPKGALGLYQESRLTGYLNDLPVISYDFQAPIGEYGFVRPSYHYYRLLHLFLAQYGNELAVCTPHYPDVSPRDRKDTFTPRCSIRVNEEKCGYVFFNTNQRNEQLDPARKIQIKLGGKDDVQLIPLQPVDIPSGISCFFPLNHLVGACIITYALMQPITELTYQGELYLFYTAIDGIPPELLFQGDMNILGTKGTQIPVGDGILLTDIPTGLDPVISYTSGELTVHIIVLKFMDALRLYKMQRNEQEHVLLSDAQMFFEENQIVLYGETENNSYEVASFPPIPFTQQYEEDHKGLFTFVRVQLRECKVMVSLEEIESKIPDTSIYAPYLFTDEPEKTKEYLLNVAVEEGGDMDDIKIYLSGEFDVMQIYEGQELTGDCFHLGGLTEIGVKRHKNYLLHEKPLHLKLSPFSANKEVFLEQKIERDQVSLSLYHWKIQYKKGLHFKLDLT